MRVLCRGWGEPRHALLIFRDDGQGGPDSDSICLDCRDYMKGILLKEERDDAQHS